MKYSILSVHFEWPLFSGEQIEEPKLLSIHVLVSACFLMSHFRCGTRQGPLAAKGLVECGFEGRHILLLPSVLRLLGIGFGDVRLLAAPLFLFLRRLSAAL